MRRDVLEHLAEEIGAHQAEPLASFTIWDEGRRKLDGMSRGKRWDIDREQREWERDNAAELAKYEARRNWAKHERTHPEQVDEAHRRWVKTNRQHLLAYRRTWAAANVERERKYGRRKHAKRKKDPKRWAVFKARQDRHKPKKNAKASAAYWALSDAERRARNQEHHQRFYRYKPKGKRRCSVCRQPGHNVKRCSVARTAAGRAQG